MNPNLTSSKLFCRSRTVLPTPHSPTVLQLSTTARRSRELISQTLQIANFSQDLAATTNRQCVQMKFNLIFLAILLHFPQEVCKYFPFHFESHKKFVKRLGFVIVHNHSARLWLS